MRILSGYKRSLLVSCAAGALIVACASVTRTTYTHEKHADGWEKTTYEKYSERKPSGSTRLTLNPKEGEIELEHIGENGESLGETTEPETDVPEGAEETEVTTTQPTPPPRVRSTQISRLPRWMRVLPSWSLSEFSFWSVAKENVLYLYRPSTSPLVPDGSVLASFDVNGVPFLAKPNVQAAAERIWQSFRTALFAAPLPAEPNVDVYVNRVMTFGFDSPQEMFFAFYDTKPILDLNVDFAVTPPDGGTTTNLHRGLPDATQVGTMNGWHYVVVTVPWADLNGMVEGTLILIDSQVTTSNPAMGGSHDEITVGAWQ